MLKLRACKECGTAFRPMSGTVFCSDECRKKAAARNQAAAKAAYNERCRAQRMMPGQWSLNYDPWRTGQLPKSVRENALWD